MRKKNGFTMIELLAIIVILAIIALIAIPVVLNIIDKVRVASYARSADNILDASRLYFKETQIDSTMSIEGNNYNKVMERISGRKPDSGSIYVYEDGGISIALKYGNYCYIKSYDQTKFTRSESNVCTVASEKPILTAITENQKTCITSFTWSNISTLFKTNYQWRSDLMECSSDIDGVFYKKVGTSTAETTDLSNGEHQINCTLTKKNGGTVSEQFNLKVGGDKVGETTIGGVTVDVVDSCNGLYLDSDGVYRYKGSNPDNYIMLGEENYRIIAIEEQGIKVIRASSNPGYKLRSNFDNGIPPFQTSECTDELCPRNNSNNTYCQNILSDDGKYYGCNIWSKADEIMKKDDTFMTTVTNGSKTGTITQNSTAYDFLHNYYDDNISSIDSYIVKDATWNMGAVTLNQTSMLLDTIKEEEKEWRWIGKIALPNLSDQIQAQDHASDKYLNCLENVYSCPEHYCIYDNWFRVVYSYTMNPVLNTDYIWKLSGEGPHSGVSSGETNVLGNLTPVLYLKSSIKLTGNGMPNNSFQIAGISE